MSSCSNAKLECRDRFPDEASVVHFVSHYLSESATDDLLSDYSATFAKALGIVEAAMAYPNNGLVRFAAQTKLLHRLVFLSGRQQSNPSAAARGLAACTALLRAQADTILSECLRDELADPLAEAAAGVLEAPASTAEDPAVRLALTELAVAVTDSAAGADAARCARPRVIELAHCQLYGMALAEQEVPQPTRAAPPPLCRNFNPPVEVSGMVEAAAGWSEADQPLLQQAIPCTVSYADIQGRLDCIYNRESSGRLYLPDIAAVSACEGGPDAPPPSPVSMQWPLMAGDRLPARSSGRLALVNPRQSARELMVGDIMPNLVSLINRSGGHLLLGVSASSCSIEGVKMQADERDSLLLGVEQILAALTPSFDPGRVSVKFHPVKGRFSQPELKGKGCPQVLQVSITRGRPINLHSYDGHVYTRTARGVVRHLSDVNDVLAWDARLLVLRSQAAAEARELRAECRRLREELVELGCEFLPSEEAKKGKDEKKA